MEKSLREEIELRKEAENILEKKVEERTLELKKSNQRLEENNKALQQFAFIASHDLQEPLRKIQTFSNIALERYMEEKEKLGTYLGKISTSATRLRSLIADLLDYSRIYADDRFMMVDLTALIQEVISDLELHTDDTPCSVALDGHFRAEVIPSQMRQLFQNLLSNSVKFAKRDRRCEIAISGEYVANKSIESPAQADGKFIRLMIRDNGIGFSNEFKERIFEIFQRLNSKTAYEGTGIGLAIVKKVVEGHDGLVVATGKENEGAIFTIVLPVKHKSAVK